MLRALIPLLLLSGVASAGPLEVFGKASYSKSHLSDDAWVESLSGSAGLALTLFSAVRLEARFSNIASLQNTMVIPVEGGNVTLGSVKTETRIYSAGLDVDLLGDRYAFQPFIYVGAGYTVKRQSFYIVLDTESIFREGTPTQGITGNVGAGFRIRLARSVALEFEAFGYGLELGKSTSTVDVLASAGLRFFF